jgi:hypothetical protein
MAKTKLGAVNEHARQFSPNALPVYASQVFSAKSGRFVNGQVQAGYITSAADGADYLMGAVDFVGTTSSTSGGTKLAVDVSTETIYEVPAWASAATTVTQAIIDAYIGKACDLKVDTNIQYADYDTATDDVLLIVGGSVADNCLYVKINAGDNLVS